MTTENATPNAGGAAAAGGTAEGGISSDPEVVAFLASLDSRYGKKITPADAEPVVVVGAPDAEPEPALEDTTPDDQPKGADALEVPEVLPEMREDMERYTADVGALGKEIGIPVEQTQRILDYAVDLAITDRSGVDVQNPDACINVLHSWYGDEAANKIIADAQAAVRKLGPKVAEWLDNTSNGNSPAVLVALAEFHRGGTRMTPDKAKAELDGIMRDQTHAYWHEDLRSHKAAVNRVRLLSVMASAPSAGADEGDPYANPKLVRSAAQTALDVLDSEIKQAQADPAYLNSSAPTHKAAVAKVNELYMRRWPD